MHSRNGIKKLCNGVVLKLEGPMMFKATADYAMRVADKRPMQRAVLHDTSAFSSRVQACSVVITLH